MLLRRCAVIAVVCIAFSGSARAQTISGRVFLDADANGQCGAGEAGVAGVPVTDGTDFVKTDSRGRYRIEVSSDPVLSDGGAQMISISWPSNTWPTSPWFAPVSDGGDGVDFGLRKDDQALPFTFVHGTDSHIPRGGKEKFLGFRKDMEAMAERVSFCVLTGDITDLSDSASCEKAKTDFALFEKQSRDFPVPLFCTPGNHDISGIRSRGRKGWQKTGPHYGYGLYTSHVGPLRWSFNYAGVHIVGIDFNRLINGRWEWGVPEMAALWLEKDLGLLDENRRIFLFVHFPKGPRKLPAVVQNFDVEQIFHGHDHVDRATTYARIPALSSGAISQIFGDKDRRTGYRIVHVTDRGIETFYRATGDPHAITVDFPRFRDRFFPENRFRGGFYDPEGVIKTLTIAIGNNKQQIPFKRGPVCCTFDAKLDLSGVAEGVRPTTISITDGKQTWELKRDRMIVTGHQGDFEPETDATLRLDVGGIDTTAEVIFNGEKLSDVGPTQLKGDNRFHQPVKGTEVIEISIPRGKLRRLNMVALAAGGRRAGEADQFCVLDVGIRYSTGLFRDSTASHGPRNPTYVKRSLVRHVDLQPGR